MKTVTKNCTNCGACIKRCPKKAISFIKKGVQEIAVIDEKKCINCGKCFKLCPSNNQKEDNKVTIKVARIKNEININKSTSGGIFGELARYFLRRRCIVYGAAYDSDFKGVHHMRCESEDELEKLLKTKYIRSKLNNIFEEVEKDLKTNNDVLFSGTPCQIAGLKKYLQKDYDNLYTVDIVCHGIPSPIIWKKYADSLEKLVSSKITSVDFRYLDINDPSKNLKIWFEDGSVINESLYDTSYGRSFFLALTTGAACSNCKFNDFRNYSDLTIGDAWGYTNDTYKYKNSIILINTKKGKKIYSLIQDNLIEFDDFNVSELIQKNDPIIVSTPNHYNHGKVNINARSIDKELWYWLDDMNGLEKDKKGVGILNFTYENINFGANLVAYSISKVVEKLGYNPHNIDFDTTNNPDTITRYQSLNFYKFRDKYLHMTPKFRIKDELSFLNNYYDMFITGSDQVWRKYITKNNYSTYFLNFIKNKNKISYGASFGNDEYDGDTVDRLNAITDISSFYKVSVRENSGVDICKDKLFRDDAEVVLDPTLLLTEKEYEEINDDLYDKKIDVAVYLMLDASNEKFYDKQFKRLFPNKKIVNVKGEFVKKPFGEVFVYNHISKWLDGIRKSKYVVTDSYHGLIFGLIHHKNVICLGKNSSSYSRFKTLIDNLGGNIDKIIFGSLKDVKSIRSVTNILDYDTIDKNIDKLRKKSMNFLKENLKKENIKEEVSFYKDVAEELSKLQKENIELKGMKDELYSVLNSRTWRMTEPLRVVKGKAKKLRRK